MSTWSIALNRFGLGRRLNERLPGDPRRWLLDQFGRYDPRPPSLARAGSAYEVVPRMNDLREARRAAKAARAMNSDRDQDAGAMAADRKMSSDQGRPNALSEFRRQARSIYLSDVEASFGTAVSSDAPFIERLVHFWSNHFAVSADRDDDVKALTGSLEFEAIRPHVMGKFSDMLLAVERHPAMLLYLDQVKSFGPNSAFLTRNAKDRGLNENLAREILELHTMGVRSGYSQDDIIELAKAMTGWTYAGGGPRALIRLYPDLRQGEFLFARRFHEPGSRTLLGRTYAQPGEDQATAMLMDLSRRPETARFVSTKLARHFAGDDPPASLVARLSKAFIENDGDLPSLYRLLVESEECWSENAAKFRSPWDWAVASARALGKDSMNGRRISNLLEQLGQPMWSPGSPAGYDDTSARWLSADTLIRRVGISSQLVSQQASEIDAKALGQSLFPGGLQEVTTMRLASAADSSLGLAILLSSPQMLRR